MGIKKVPDIELIKLYEIAPLLLQKRLSPTFIKEAFDAAGNYEGVFNLLILWRETTDEKEKAEIISDIQDLIEDINRIDFSEAAYIRFDDLDAIGSQIAAFKNSLLLKVNERVGGITKLAELTGIPQPSLSRFFNSPSMPRKSTLLKIAKALGLSQIEIATEWVD